MARWSDGVPIVRIGVTETPKRVTFVYPYYNNRQFLADQIAGWAAYSADVRAHVSAVIVDDGSPDPAVLPLVLPLPIRLFRIGVDIPWNWLAARNIGAHHAEAGWLLLTDMDHVVPPETAEALVYGRHDPRAIYLFSRREHTGAVVGAHSASFLMTRDLFWRIGGYDEMLSGHYGSDGEYRRRAMRHAPLLMLTDALVRYEYVGDSSTIRYPRKLPVDTAFVQRHVLSRTSDWRPKVLSFPYGEVTC